MYFLLLLKCNLSFFLIALDFIKGYPLRALWMSEKIRFLNKNLMSLHCSAKKKYSFYWFDTLIWFSINNSKFASNEINLIQFPVNQQVVQNVFCDKSTFKESQVRFQISSRNGFKNSANSVCETPCIY